MLSMRVQQYMFMQWNTCVQVANQLYSDCIFVMECLQEGCYRTRDVLVISGGLDNGAGKI